MGIESPARVWLIGDAQTDMECAERAGCVAVGFGLDLTSRKIAVKNCHELLAQLAMLKPI
jgi:phosphoglycolate phosphatase-like HAD superfamily hydrolase